MKCDNCGGRLEGMMKFCPYCGVRQNIDLRQINYRDIHTHKELPCPSCSIPLGVVEVMVGETPVCIEHCGSCQGLFFNPGELELLLDLQSHEIVWVDTLQLADAANTFSNDGAVVYRKCPVCVERMSPHNFGGKSGVILDRCGSHGFWLDGGELRKLAEWWRAGGRLIYQQSEADRARWLSAPKARPAVIRGTVDSGMPAIPTDPTIIPDFTGSVVGHLLGGLADILLP